MIMTMASMLFLVLFIFLLFVFVVYIISRFKKRDYDKFEPNLSIIIPVYNEEKHIKDCIDSIHKSNYPQSKMEIIVIDDGSTDDTFKILSQYNDIKLLKQNHGGKSAATDGEDRGARRPP